MAPNTPEYQAYCLGLLERAITERHNERGEGGAAVVAKEMGCTESLISQLRGGTYSHPARKYRQIIELYGSETVQCPTMGQISLNICAEERSKPSGIAPSAAYVRQRQACKKCERRS